MLVFGRITKFWVYFAGKEVTLLLLNTVHRTIWVWCFLFTACLWMSHRITVTCKSLLEVVFWRFDIYWVGPPDKKLSSDLGLLLLSYIHFFSSHCEASMIISILVIWTLHFLSLPISWVILCALKQSFSYKNNAC